MKIYEDFYGRNRFFKLLGNIKVMVVVTYLVAPLTGIKYFAKTKSFDLYCYFIVVHAAYLSGYLDGVRKAQRHFEKERMEEQAEQE